MDENLIYSIAAVIIGLAIGTGLLYILYLKGILNTDFRRVFKSNNFTLIKISICSLNSCFQTKV
ncbi:MAG: hypothetical protein CVT88_09660, partial [Candidatus Altiarchaeales archaeon HGW-Altiarchaeales-1]